MAHEIVASASDPMPWLKSVLIIPCLSCFCNHKKALHSRSAIRPNVFGLVNSVHLHGLPADTREGKAYPVIGSNDGKLSAKRDQFRQTPSFLPPADPANHQKCCLHAPKMICAANAGKNTSRMAGTILCTSLHAKGNSPLASSYTAAKTVLFSKRSDFTVHRKKQRSVTNPLFPSQT